MGKRKTVEALNNYVLDCQLDSLAIDDVIRKELVSHLYSALIDIQVHIDGDSILVSLPDVGLFGSPLSIASLKRPLYKESGLAVRWEF